MKSYTNLEQSKKLAEKLPIESADMSINHSLFHNKTTVLTTPYKKLHEFFSGDTPDTILPCWSLAALLDILPNGTVLTKSDNGRYFIGGLLYDNPLDACVDKIYELKEKDLI